MTDAERKEIASLPIEKLKDISLEKNRLGCATDKASYAQKLLWDAAGRPLDPYSLKRREDAKARRYGYEEVWF